MALVGLIMAGGIGTRMKSATNKLLHPILGREVIRFPVESLREGGAERVVLVVGPHNQETLKGFFQEKVEYALQSKPLGTADAVKAGVRELGGFQGELLITVGDNPYLDAATVKEFLEYHRAEENDVSIITTEFDNHPPYGRIVKDRQGRFLRIVEEVVASPEEKRIKEVSSSIFVFRWPRLLSCLERVEDHNPKREFFLVDAINIGAAEGLKVGIFKVEEQEITEGINNREDLTSAISYFNRKNQKRLGEGGVTFVSPENTFVEFDVEIGNDTVVYPFNYLRRGTVIPPGSTVFPFTYR